MLKIFLKLLKINNLNCNGFNYNDILILFIEKININKNLKKIFKK